MSIFYRLLLISIVAPACCCETQVASAADAFATATQFYQTNRWQQAVTAFDQLAQDSSQEKIARLTAQVYAGEALVQLGRLAEARQRFEHLQKQAPPARLAAQSLFRLGEVAWIAGESNEAQELLQSYVAKHPSGESISYAQDYLQQIRQHLARESDFSELDKAVGWEREGRHDAALAAYRRILKQRSADPVIRTESLRRAGRLHEQLTQTNEAIKLYQQFLTENPHSKHTAEIMYAVAWLLDRLDQTTQAADQFETLAEKFPQSSQAAGATYWLALKYADDENTEQAFQLLDRLLAYDSWESDQAQLLGKALCLKCQLLADQGEWSKIEALVASAVERVEASSLSTKLAFWAAEASFRLDDYDLAAQRFTALYPKTIGINESWTAMIPLRRAQLAARRQQWSKVLKTLEQLERDYPEFELDYEIDYLRGRALAGRGNMTAARRFYRRVLGNQAAADTEAATMAGWMIGETFFHQHDYVRARNAYEAVMDQTALPEWRSRAALQAGKCWELEQRWDEASKVYQTALDRWPSSQSDEQIQIRLRWAQKQTKAAQRR